MILNGISTTWSSCGRIVTKIHCLLYCEFMYIYTNISILVTFFQLELIYYIIYAYT